MIMGAHYKTVWLSDIHLGNKDCKAEYLLDFLENNQIDTLYLVGDIIDIWSMQRTMYWSQSHNNVIRTLLGKAKRGTKIIYVPGNHDEQFRACAGMVFGNIEVHNEYVHTTPAGKKILILHGDKFDTLMQCNGLMNFIGNKSYDLLLYLNRHLCKWRQHLGFPYWSLAASLKKKVKDAMSHIRKYEEIVSNDARERGYDGVICGHIHHAEMRMIDNTLYCNDGDWVENCTALVENRNGQMELIHWTDKQEILGSMAISDAHNSEKAA